MLAIGVALVGFVLLLSRSLAFAPAGGILLALVLPRKFLRGTVPARVEEESKRW